MGLAEREAGILMTLKERSVLVMVVTYQVVINGKRLSMFLKMKTKMTTIIMTEAINNSLQENISVIIPRNPQRIPGIVMFIRFYRLPAAPQLM